VACGSGFLVVSVALPHRSALVANERHALKPEQVMNRCIRGVMAALRSLGVDSIYPGLDLLTCERRAVAHLSFVETQGGATLFQTILAVEQSFARTARLLDPHDPDGRVPTVMMDAAETTTLGERSPAARRVRLTAASFVEQVAAGYREAFGVEPTDLDPEVTEVLAAGYADEPDPVHLPPHPEGASTARTVGLLGPIEACVATRSGAIEAAVIYGDFLAPEHMVEELDRALRGCPLSREQIAQVVRSVLDGSNGYVLGLKPAEVALLLASACGLEP
jgi:hypothetical protein